MEGERKRERERERKREREREREGLKSVRFKFATSCITKYAR